MRRIFSLHHQTRRPSSNISLPPEPPPNLSTLPPDLLERLLSVLDPDVPCALCSLNREWARWGRCGWLYNLTNRALGY